MPYTEAELEAVFEKTQGYCAYCGKQLSWSNYGISGGRGGWEVDHQNPRARGGSDYLRNLSAACIPCNRDKRDRTAQSYRQEFAPATVGGRAVEWLGLAPGSLGASRRRIRRE